MNLFDKFDTKEQLLSLIDQAIVQDENQKFYLSDFNGEFEKMKQDLMKMEELKSNMLSLEKKNLELEQTAETQKKTIEELSQLNPLELQETIKKLATEKAQWSVALEKMEKEMGPLKEELEMYHRKEIDSKIQEALLQAAKDLGIRQEAFRDVVRLAPLLFIDEQGKICTEDGLTVKQLVEKEKKLSPHWDPISVGGGSRSVAAVFPANISGLRFEEARSHRDISGMIINAPIIE
ncbi:MAG: hypothetical protein Q4G69_00835 [Planctomycetia bacterium]|nr:hypothetical protein [Planctomycetia bacterium]